MKHLYCSILAFMFMCTSLIGQNNLILNIDHRLGSEIAAFNVSTDQGDYMFDLTRLQYYISDIEVMHDGGTTTAIEDVWLLVSANGAGQFELGSWDIEIVESVSFHIGVGPDVNHEDPAAWSSDHALHPQNPSMHWGWASGYRFVCIEGNAGPTAPINLFQIHALGDNNYFQTDVTVSSSAYGGTVSIPLIADYSKALTDIDVSSGLINHATNGVSIPLLQNFSTEVFTAAVTNSLEELDFEGELFVSPNPSSGAAALNLLIPTAGEYSVQIIDMNGRTVKNLAVNKLEGVIGLPDLSSGLYVIELLRDAQPLKAIRWAVK